MNMPELRYILPEGRGQLIFTGPVLEHMFSQKQKHWLSRESGGQLFASFGNENIVVTEATGPRKQDKRGRFSFWPHRPSEQKEINQRYKEAGLHFVGDWHTHPERTPNPSGGDADSVAKMFGASKHDLFGVLLVVVGTDDPPGGLYVGLHDRTGLHELTLIDAQDV